MFLCSADICGTIVYSEHCNCINCPSSLSNFVSTFPGLLALINMSGKFLCHNVLKIVVKFILKYYKRKVLIKTCLY